MKRILYTLLVAAVAVACGRNSTAEQWPEEKGGVQLKVELHRALEQAASKAPVQDAFPITSEHLEAEVLQGGKRVALWSPLTQMPQIAYLERGDYTMVVRTRGTRGAVNNMPLYKGSSDFSIQADRVSSVAIDASLYGMVVALHLAGDLANLTEYTLRYFALDKPQTTLFTLTQAQNSPEPQWLYFDTPFAYGVKIEGRLDGKKWSKNVVVYDPAELLLQTRYTLVVSNQ